MDLDLAEAIVRELLAPQSLSPIQLKVFGAAWRGSSYREFADEAGYDFDYIKGVGAQVWKMLGTATKQKVNKGNVRSVLESFITIVEPANVAIVGNELAADPRLTVTGEAVDISAFYGRELERDLLKSWTLPDRCQVVTILGMGGMGKTMLALDLVRELRSLDSDNADRFSHILWRSLLVPPLLRELLPELLRSLIESPRLTVGGNGNDAVLAPLDVQLDLIPKTVTGQMELLLEICQKYRCAIVLDRVDALFQAQAQVGEYRDGYEDYGELLSAFGQTQHQSCLVLTSREKPTEIARLEGIDATVRTMRLAGLDLTAGVQIFTNRGCLPISPSEWAEIDRYCEGNPLVLQSIANTVREIADGDVSEIYDYLRSNNLGFADIYAFVEEHWERLTLAEEQLVYWLAIACEPMSIVDLEACLHPAWNLQERGNGSLLNVLQSLHHRSIISTRAGRIETTSMRSPQTGKRQWSLPPTIVEYAIGRAIGRICLEIERQQPFLLDTHALVWATAPEYLRQAQLQTIVRPIIERLRLSIGNVRQIGDRLRLMLAKWRVPKSQQSGYLAGNIINFLVELKLDLTDLDCGGAVVRQAYLASNDLVRVNFTNARTIDCTFAHTFSRILAIAYSPDGRLFAASDSNGDIRVWRDGSAHCVLICRGHSNWVRAIQFSPDNRYLASSSDDRTIALWDLQDGRRVQTIGSGIHSLGLSFSPDGRYLASGSTDNIIYYWHLATGRGDRQFIGHSGWSMSVCFHPQGRKLVSGGADGSVRVWDVASGKCDRVLPGHANIVTTVDYSPDGKTILSSSLDGSLRLWDATEQTKSPDCRIIQPRQDKEIWSAAFSPDGSQFAGVGMGGSIGIWRSIDGNCLHQWQSHNHERLWAVAFHPNGQHFASGGEDLTIRVWQVSDTNCLQVLHGNCNWLRSIAWSRDGHSLIAGSRNGRVHVWSLPDLQPPQQLSAHTKPVVSVAYDPHGLTFASGSDDGTIGIWDAQTSSCLQILRRRTEQITALTYSHDGRYLVSASEDLAIAIWQTEQWRFSHILSGHTDRIGNLAYHPHRDLIASASEDRTIRIWNLHDRDPIVIFSQHPNRAISVAFAPCGTMVASGGIDREILLWNIDTGSLCHKLTGHEGWILSLAYSPDGQWLVSGASDRTIKIWSMATKQCQHTLSGHQGWVWSVSISNCGRFIATASEDGTIRIWDIATGILCSTHRPDRPYEGMKITGISGLTALQIEEFKRLGAQG